MFINKVKKLLFGTFQIPSEKHLKSTLGTCVKLVEQIYLTVLIIVHLVYAVQSVRLRKSIVKIALNTVKPDEINVRKTV